MALSASDRDVERSVALTRREMPNTFDPGAPWHAASMSTIEPGGTKTRCLRGARRFMRMSSECDGSSSTRRSVALGAAAYASRCERRSARTRGSSIVYAPRGLSRRYLNRGSVALNVRANGPTSVEVRDADARHTRAGLSAPTSSSIAMSVSVRMCGSVAIHRLLSDAEPAATTVTFGANGSTRSAGSTGAAEFQHSTTPSTTSSYSGET
mmetsp:Transcript_2459/g.9414  ORF Transcript_2459/g.9414 Transcript_2459/m.9414 type:complete len:210 (-) Transcript_2459:566-1195(-)